MDNDMQVSTGSTSRKRPREGETDSQRIKREKAAERQRRKRERDRNAAVGILAYSADGSQQGQQQQAPQPQGQQQQHGSVVEQGEMTLEEMARRDRVRAAARERQRKHRRMIKERKMRELGVEMGGEMLGMEEAGYRQGDSQYSQVLHDMQPIPISHEPPFPQTNLIGGQTFASTLLLSFSCAPLLKQHLLRTLNMTNDELASLEPIIAEAWDRWDHQVPPSFSPPHQLNYFPPTAPHPLCRTRGKRSPCPSLHAPLARRARQSCPFPPKP